MPILFPQQKGDAPILRDNGHMSVLGIMLPFGTTEGSILKGLWVTNRTTRGVPLSKTEDELINSLLIPTYV